MNHTHSAGGRFKRCLAAVLLTLPLVQVAMFFTGMLVPVRRFVLWGKSRPERLTIAWPVGRQLEEWAQEFPLDARIYMVDPDEFLHRQAQYYFLPRTISITMTNRGWTQDIYHQWVDRPTADWLVQHGFTFVLKLTVTNGAGGWAVAPAMRTPPGVLREP